MKNSFKLKTLLYGFLFLSLVFGHLQSVNAFPLFPQASPNTILPENGLGVTDSLSMAQKFADAKDYKKALEVSLAVLEGSKRMNDVSTIKKSSLLIAEIFDKTNYFEKAIHYYKSALVYLKPNEKIEQTRLQLKIGDNLYQIQEKDSAIYYFQKISDVKSENDTIIRYKAKAFTNLSGIYLEKSNYSKAEYYAQQAIEIFEKNKKYHSAAIALNNLGNIYMQQQKYQQAKETFHQAINHLNKTKDSYEKINAQEAIFDNLSKVLYYLKDYNAYTYQEDAYTIRDSIRSIQLSGILAEIEGKYNTESIKKQEQLKIAKEQAKSKHAKDVSIILGIILFSSVFAGYFWFRNHKLKQEKLLLEVTKNKLVQQQELERIQNETRDKILNAALDSKENERKMIAETLHHSVSSLLSSANLHLQAIKMQLIASEQTHEVDKAQKIINEAAEKIRNLSHSLVSSVLLKFGLVYSIQDLCEKYSNNTLTFNYKGDGIKRYEQEFELKINNIIDELLNNIIKHSKATQANIFLKSSNDNLEIEINDNGVGFDPSVKMEKSGLGLSQIEARIKKLKGEMTVESIISVGTVITINVPIQYKAEEKIIEV